MSRIHPKRVHLAAATLAAALSAACLQVATNAGSGTPSCCSEACVEIVLGCHLHPEGATDDTCFVPELETAGIDAGPAIEQYAADACTSGNEGAEVGCIAAKFPGNACAVITADAGGAALQMDIELACPKGFSPGQCDAACLTCQEQCLQTSGTCDAQCYDAGGFYGCLGCNASCNQAQAKCEQGCLAQ